MVTSQELKEIDAQIKNEIDEAVVAAKTEPEIPLEELYADVYAKPLETQIRGLTPFTEHHHKSIEKPQNVQL